MGTYIMFGTYSAEAMKGMSVERTAKSTQLITNHGGEVISMYAMLGEKDLVFIANFPNSEQAMKASVALSKATNITFSTAPAVTVNAFDKLMADV